MKRCPLSKRIPRDFAKNCGKYLGMILILVCTISIGSSFQTTLDGATRYLEDIKDNKMQEDGYVEAADKIDTDDHYFADKGINIYENFYVTDNSFQDDAKLLVFKERKSIDLPTIFEGKLPEAMDEIALDHVYARGKGIKIGETVKVLGRDFKVCGTVSMSDYTALFLNNTDIVMNTAHFCVAIVTEGSFSAFKEANVTYRYSYRYEERNLSKAEKKSISEDMLKYLYGKGASLATHISAENNQSITFLELDIGTDRPFMTVFVYLLVAVIAFVFAILTNNTIEGESVIIGTLLASGYSKKEIIWHYLQPTLIVAIIGSVVGNAIGYTVMINPFLDLYYTSYSIGPIEVKFSFPAFLLTTILPVVIMVAINCFMLIRKLSLSPLRFLRRDLKKSNRKKAVKLPDFSFLSRFRLRVILQNKGSYFLLFFGVFLASFLLMFGIGLEPLMNHYTESIDESLPFDYQYILKAPTDVDKGEKMYVYEMETWFKLGNKSLGISLMGIDEDSTFFKDALSDEGVSISSALSKKLNLKKGDIVKLTDKSNDKEYELKVEKIYSYNASMAVFIERSKLNRLLGNDLESFNSIISNEKISIDENYLAKEILREDMLGAADQMMDSFRIVILFVNVFSVIVYIILMYILTKVVIDKNALSISYMKVFGYQTKEIRKLYLTATTMVVAFSLIVCIPIEIQSFKVILVFLSSMIEGYLEFYLPIWVYFEIIVIGIVAYLVINAIHVHGINKIPMTEALKNRE